MTSIVRWRIALLLSLSLPCYAWAATFGPVRVLSHLGQPLHLEVEVTDVSAQGLKASDVRIGGVAASRSSPLLRNLLPTTYRQSNGVWVVDIRTRAPITRPSLEFPLELDSGGMHLTKGISVLLDPPGVSDPFTGGRTAGQGKGAAPRPKTYRVRAGDTLGSIASRFKPTGYSAYRMALALYRANPGAFYQDDIDHLRVGALLLIPKAGAVPATGDRIAGNRTSLAEPGAYQGSRQLAYPNTRRIVATGGTRPTRASQERGRLQVLQGQVSANAQATPRQLQRALLQAQEDMEQSLLEKQREKDRLADVRFESAKLHRILELQDKEIAAVRAAILAKAKAKARAKAVQAAALKRALAAKAQGKKPGAGLAGAAADWGLPMLLLVSAVLLGLVLARRQKAPPPAGVAAIEGELRVADRRRRPVAPPALSRLVAQVVRLGGTVGVWLARFRHRLARQAVLLRAVRGQRVPTWALRLAEHGRRLRATLAAQRLALWRWLLRRRGAAGDYDTLVEMARTCKDLGDLVRARGLLERALAVASSSDQRQRALALRASLNR